MLVLPDCLLLLGCDTDAAQLKEISTSVEIHACSHIKVLDELTIEYLQNIKKVEAICGHKFSDERPKVMGWFLGEENEVYDEENWLYDGVNEANEVRRKFLAHHGCDDEYR